MQQKILALPAFFALNMIMLEIHEQLHIQAGFLICGCYGERNFHVWELCGYCIHPQLTFLALLAGPVFSCVMMWLGAFWFVKNENQNQRAFGFALLFANMPLARIFTSLTGRGDEKTAAGLLFGNSTSPTLTASLITLLCCLPPVIMVWRKMCSNYKGWIVSGFLLVPMIYGMLYSHIFLNWLLERGIGASIHIMGTPDLILIHLILMIILFTWTDKRLSAFSYHDAGENRLGRNA